ncbi:MAG: hypothetical protein R6U58_10195 [Bacteroidales bacterium]
MVSFRITAILPGRDRLTIISASDISDELAREEKAAWKKMIRFIAHKLMNSITPMKTLAFAMHTSFSPEGNLVCCPSPDEGSVFLISLPLK